MSEQANPNRSEAIAGKDIQTVTAAGGIGVMINVALKIADVAAPGLGTLAGLSIGVAVTMNDKENE